MIYRGEIVSEVSSGDCNRNIVRFRYYTDITAVWEIGFNTGVRRSYRYFFIRILSVFGIYNGENTEIYTGTVSLYRRKHIFHFLRTTTFINIQTSYYSKYCFGFRLFIIVSLDQFFNNIIKHSL